MSEIPVIITIILGFLLGIFLRVGYSVYREYGLISSLTLIAGMFTLTVPIIILGYYHYPTPDYLGPALGIISGICFFIAKIKAEKGW